MHGGLIPTAFRSDSLAISLSMVSGAYTERRTIRREGGIAGQTISIEGLFVTATDVLVRVESLNGATQIERLSPAKTGFVVQSAPGDWEVVTTYLPGHRAYPVRLRSSLIRTCVGDPCS